MPVPFFVMPLVPVPTIVPAKAKLALVPPAVKTLGPSRMVSLALAEAKLAIVWFAPVVDMSKVAKFSPVVPFKVIGVAAPIWPAVVAIKEAGESKVVLPMVTAPAPAMETVLAALLRIRVPVLMTVAPV